MMVGISRKKCPITFSEFPQFFTLVDYRNNYFISNDSNKIIEFYNGFENRDQLIRWMKERPKGVVDIREVEGKKDIIVVIPTADFNGKYARECRDNIFKGLHMVFVESGEVPDPYFNYAHSCNVGIKEAMKYNPKWVVVSNDDMQKIDDINVLQQEISILDYSRLDAVFVGTQNRLPRRWKILRLNYFYNLSQILLRKGFRKEINALREKFQVAYLPVPIVTLVYRYLFIKGPTMFDFRDFIILSANFVRDSECMVFDEIFVNDREDNDLAIRLRINGRTATIDYAIKTIGAISLGMSVVRSLRSVASETYLNYKWEKFLHLKCVA